jgi:hypothetical protein
MGISETDFALSMIQSVTDKASRSIESGDDAEKVISSTTKFCIAGLTTLAN